MYLLRNVNWQLKYQITQEGEVYEPEPSRVGYRNPRIHYNATSTSGYADDDETVTCGDSSDGR